MRSTHSKTEKHRKETYLEVNSLSEEFVFTEWIPSALFSLLFHSFKEHEQRFTSFILKDQCLTRRQIDLVCFFIFIVTTKVICFLQAFFFLHSLPRAGLAWGLRRNWTQKLGPKTFPAKWWKFWALFPTKKPKCSNKVAVVNLILYNRYLTCTLTFFSVAICC